MLPALLITFREVIEASLIVATIMGILVRLKQTKSIRTAWIATGAAALTSVLLLGVGSVLGLKVQELYEEQEALIEGILMITSAVFITWAVFFLHNYFGTYKTHLLQKIKATVEQNEQKALFILVFTAVFREGFEIVLFLSTMYFSENPRDIFSGFALGAGMALLVSFALFNATLRMPVYYAFRVTSILLILFAAGLLGRGIHEFEELGAIPELGELTMAFIPASTTFAGGMIKAIFGISQKMQFTQIAFYSLYTLFMSWWVFGRSKESHQE